MEPKLKVSLLGTFEVELPGSQIAQFRTRRAAELIGLLSLTATRKISREEVATQMWPDKDVSGGLVNLRPALNYARAALKDAEAIHSSDGYLSLSHTVSTDLLEIERIESKVRTASSSEDRLIKLFTLNNLTLKPLLSNWNHEWLEPYRRYHDHRRIRVLLQLCEELGSRGEWAAGLAHVEQVMELDSTSEEGVRLQLRFLAELQRREEAQRIFASYAKNLKSELDLEVGPGLREFARAVIEGSTGSSNSRPLTSLQQEFIHHSLEMLAEQEPERLLPLFASPKLNWSVVLHGTEMRPYLERVLAHTSGWSPERAATAKRLLQVYVQEIELEPLRRLATSLLESDRYRDKIAALNYLSGLESEKLNYVEARSNLVEALKLAEGEGDSYLAAVSRANLAITSVHFEMYEEGRRDLVQVRRELMSQTEPNALYSVSVANAWLVRAYYGLGDLVRAREAGEEWLRFAEINGVLSQDAEGKAIYGLLLAQSGDRGASQWLVQAIDTAISARRKAALEAVALHVLGAMPNLGLDLFVAEGARVIRNCLRLEARNLSPFFDRLLAVASSGGVPNRGETYESVIDILVSAKQQLLAIS